MNGENPCNICKSRDEFCDGCILDNLTWSSKGECCNYECMLNYECGCLLSMDDVCKASTCFSKDADQWW